MTKSLTIDSFYSGEEIRLSKFILGVGIFGIIVGILLGLVLVTSFSLNNESEFYSVLSMFIFFTFGGIYITLYFFRHKLFINDEEVVEKTILGTLKKLKWTEIEKVSMLKTGQGIILKNINTKIKIEFSFRDVTPFLALMLTKIDFQKIPDELINEYKFLAYK